MLTFGVRALVLPAAIPVVFVLLAVAGAATRAPWCDEAYFAEPALQILQIGRMATLVSPPSPIDDIRTTGTDKFIFWTLPLDIVLQAGWYKILGFGMIRMRLLATVWGLIAIAAWWIILTRLGAAPRLRLAATALIALDYSFIRSGSEGRMDMMSAALGFAGIAVFLTLEERGYLRAALAGSACTAASAFTHPIGGLLATVGFGLTMLWYSRGRFRWWHPAVVAVPYLVFAAGWGIYILQAPELFRAQLLSQSGGRLNGWQEPFHTIWREFTQRWGGVFGLTAGRGLKRIRALVLIAYIAGVLAAIVRFRKLTQAGFGLVLAICLVNLALLCFVENTKSAAYLVSIVPWLAMLLAVLLTDYWRRFGAAVFATILAIQVLGSVYTISRFEYQREFMPAVRAIQANGGQVTGDAQLGFGLGFTPKLVDDHRLGYYTDAKPKLFAMDEAYDGFRERYRTLNPAISQFIDAKLARSRLVFENSLYRLYLDPDPR